MKTITNMSKYTAALLLVVIVMLGVSNNCQLNAAPQWGVSKQENGATAQNRLSLTLQDMDVREVLTNLSEEMGKRFVISPDVMGKISLSLRDATPERALDEVLRLANLKAQHQGDIVSISPNRRVGPSVLTEKAFPLRTSDVEEIRKLVEVMLSKGGSVFINEKARVVLVRDYAANIDNIEAVLRKFDPAPRQIAVDAAILSVTKGDEKTFGVKWSGLDSSIHHGKQLSWQASTEGLVMPIASGASGLFTAISYASIANFIEALQKVNTVKILSRPNILAVEGEEAQIIVGKKLGYRTMMTTVTQNTMENIEFLEVGTQLIVTPYVIDVGTIMLMIHPEVSDGEISSDGLPSESTSEVTTRVIVRTGQTVVIGGMLSDKKGKTVHAVPILGSIPLLGRLFKRTEDYVTRSEMVVLITPRLIDTGPDSSMNRDIERSKKHFQDW